MGILFLILMIFNLYFSYHIYRFFYPKQDKKNRVVKSDVEFLKGVKNENIYPHSCSCDCVKSSSFDSAE